MSLTIISCYYLCMCSISMTAVSTILNAILLIACSRKKNHKFAPTIIDSIAAAANYMSYIRPMFHVAEINTVYYISNLANIRHISKYININEQHCHLLGFHQRQRRRYREIRVKK